MVTHLLTITIKVNIPLNCRIAVQTRGDRMKKAKTGRGFWSWLMGQGWDTAGGNG
jgi:hypothetical protein